MFVPHLRCYQLHILCMTSESPTSLTPRSATSPSSGQPVPELHHTEYFTFPITHTVSSLLRRLSGDAPRSSRRSASKGPGSGASSLYSSYDESLGAPPTSNPLSISPDNSLFHQATHRAAAPYQPPPLTPLSLGGYSESTSEKSKQLTRQLAEEIRLLVPARLQLTEEWRLIYSLEQDGVSLATLYKKCAAYKDSRKRGGFVLVIKDTTGGIFGAYLSDAPGPQAHYYGTGECFLWRSAVLPKLNSINDLDLSSLPPPPSEDTSSYNARQSTLMSPTRNGFNGAGGRSGMSTPDRIRFKAFPYSGMNDYMLFCQTDYLSVGGG